MVARIQKLIALMVISLTVAVISLPMTADAAKPVVTVLAPVTQAVKSPTRLAMAQDGGFYVADPRSSGILRYSAAGTLLQTFRTPGVPQGIAVLANGNLVVTQGSFASIIDAVSGLQVTTLMATFGFADGVALDDSGSIYIVDGKNYRVGKFQANGALDTSFGTNGYIGARGTGQSQFLLPTAVAFDKSGTGRIAVVDSAGESGSSRIQFFNRAGTYLTELGSFNAAGALTFAYPLGITFEYSGISLSRMYVVDGFSGVVQVVDMSTSTPAFLGYIGEYGSDLSKGQLILPTDVAYDAINKRLVVANGFGNISLYGIDGGVTPPDNGGSAPALEITNQSSSTTGTTINLYGTVTAGSAVYCTLGVVPYSASVTGTAWNCNVSGLLQNSTNTVEVKATNSTSYATVKLAYVVSSTSSTYTVDAIPALGKVTPLTVSGTANAGVTLCVRNNGGACQNVTATTWSVPVALAQGANAITVETSGAPTWSGNTVLDTIAPVFASVSMVNTASAFAHDQVQNITGVLTEANPATVTVNGVAAALNGNIFSAAVVGATSFDIVATDLMGNSATVNKTIKYDPSKAAIVVNSHADGSVVSSTVQTITGTVSKAGTVTVKGVSATVAGSDWSAPVTLTAGINDIQIVAQDGSAAKLTLFVDAAKPVVAVTLPDRDLTTKELSVSVNPSASSVVSISSIINGTSTAQVSNVPFTVNLAQDGSYPITVAATDASGNTSYTVRTVVRDTAPPALTVTEATGNVTTISGTSEPGAAVVVKTMATPQVAVGTVAYSNSTSWTATLGASTDPLTLVVQATDAAGNQISKFPFAATDGNINLAGGIGDADDARFCMDVVIAHGPRVTSPDITLLQLAHGDIAPLVNGVSSPDGAIDIIDCLLILRKASGL